MSFTLNPQALPMLISMVEEHMMKVVTQANRVSRHCKRARQHPVEGDEGDEAEDDRLVSSAIRRRVHAADVNMALQLLNAEQLYATDIVPPSHEDATKPVNLKELIQYEAERMPMAPSEVGIHRHWLAVDGKQPQIPQNPSSSVLPEISLSSSKPAAGDTVSLKDGSVQIQRLQSSLLSEELLLYYIRLTTSMERGGATAADRKEQDAVITSVAQDPGLQEVVPFIVRYCQQELTRHCNNTDHCRTLIRLASALLSNPHLHLELHLHELLPSLMTCVVSKKVPISSGATEGGRRGGNHWALRSDAAAVLRQTCQAFGEDYVTLKARVLKALCDAATPTNESLPSRYGGIVAITIFGAKAVDAFLLSTLLQSWRDWQEALDKHQDLSVDLKFAIQMCQRAALDALSIFLTSLMVGDGDYYGEDAVERLNYEELADTLGDQCVPLQGLWSDYNCCFV
jgi:transcription initiation factor TFIID subunit 6